MGAQAAALMRQNALRGAACIRRGCIGVKAAGVSRKSGGIMAWTFEQSWHRAPSSA